MVNVDGLRVFFLGVLLVIFGPLFLRALKLSREQIAKQSPELVGAEKADARSRRIRKDTVAKVMRRAGGACEQCGSDSDLEIEHLVPVSQGGSNAASNLKLLCGNCIRSKGALR
jgi:5-methylcytosine-specific restriction endonuclease McrA